jgi:hypothetical protein
MLAGILTLSDPAPGQIFSERTAAAAILESFAARGDLALASRQCAVLAVAALALSLPLLAASLRGLGLATLTRVPRRASLRGVTPASTCTALALLSVSALLILPALGLALPLWHGPSSSLASAFGLAFDRIGRLDSSAMRSGPVNRGRSCARAGGVGRSRRLRARCPAVILLAIPVAVPAFGLAALATSAPEWGSCCAVRLRVWFARPPLPPIASLALRAWSSTAPACLRRRCGISLRLFVGRVLLSALALAWQAAALVAPAQMSWRCYPPSASGLVCALIFTVMVNAPETIVAALCVAGLMLAGVLTDRGRPCALGRA